MFINFRGLQSENNKKKTKSSITYVELVDLVNEYDKTHCGPDQT